MKCKWAAMGVNMVATVPRIKVQRMVLDVPNLAARLPPMSVENM